jgi:hypothetical protein
VSAIILIKYCIIYFSIKAEKDLPLKSCGGLSDVHVHADRRMQMHGTVKETEQMLKIDFLPTAEKIKLPRKQEDVL